MKICVAFKRRGDRKLEKGNAGGIQIKMDKRIASNRADTGPNMRQRGGKPFSRSGNGSNMRKKGGKPKSRCATTVCLLARKRMKKVVSSMFAMIRLDQSP